MCVCAGGVWHSYINEGWLDYMFLYVCGWAMHEGGWEGYTDNVRVRERDNTLCTPLSVLITAEQYRYERAVYVINIRI